MHGHHCMVAVHVDGGVPSGFPPPRRGPENDEMREKEWRASGGIDGLHLHCNVGGYIHAAHVAVSGEGCCFVEEERGGDSRAHGWNALHVSRIVVSLIYSPLNEYPPSIYMHPN